MPLSPERRQNIRNRIEPILRKLDPGLTLVEILLDSTREHLAFVVQVGERPFIFHVEYLLYVRMTDEELERLLEQQFAEAKVSQ